MFNTFLKGIFILFVFCLVISPIAQAEADTSESQEGKVIYEIRYDYDAILILLKMDRKKYDEYWGKGFSIAEMAERQGVSKRDVEEYFVSFHLQEMQEWRDKGKLSEFDYFDLVYRLKEDIEEFINRNSNFEYHGTVNAKTNDTPPSFEEEIIKGKQLTPLESQLMSFINGLMVTEPKQAVELWILGVNNRSGGVQYAMLSPALRKQSRSKFEETHWITGQSSPSVSNFRFTKVEKLSESKMRYTVKYDLWASYGDFGGGEKSIIVETNLEPFKEYWFISSITTEYNPWEAFTPAETVKN